MKTLHILNKAPEHPRFQRCLNALAAGDALLLIENAVLGVSGGQTFHAKQVYALTPDLEARGMMSLIPGADINPIGFEDMVALATTSQNVISW